VKRPFLTVLTTPIPSDRRRLYLRARRLARRFVKPDVPLPKVSPYPGHFAVVRSAVEGLRAIGADFNHDPKTFNELARVVYAPANEALRQAADLKRAGRIDFLVAGPANALFPEEADNILLDPAIDLLIVPSGWVRELYRASGPHLIEKTRVCPSGVDADAWKPSGSDRESQCVVYWKSGDEKFVEEIETIIESRVLEPVRVRYGHYKTTEYKELLDKSVFGVFLSSFETQGLALAEAWSMDVPTLVWDPRGDASYRGRSFAAGSSAPYISDATGITWASAADLHGVLDHAIRHRQAFRPREWVLGHMTDASCAAYLLSTIKSEAIRKLGLLTSS
jgi:hypothetical protein